MEVAGQCEERQRGQGQGLEYGRALRKMDHHHLVVGPGRAQLATITLHPSVRQGNQSVTLRETGQLGAWPTSSLTFSFGPSSP